MRIERNARQEVANFMAHLRKEQGYDFWELHEGAEDQSLFEEYFSDEEDAWHFICWNLADACDILKNGEALSTVEIAVGILSKEAVDILDEIADTRTTEDYDVSGCICGFTEALRHVANSRPDAPPTEEEMESIMVPYRNRKAFSLWCEETGNDLLDYLYEPTKNAPEVLTKVQIATA